MACAEGANPIAFLVTAKTAKLTASSDKTVIERLSITARLLELDVVPDFFGNGSGILAQLSADALK